METQRYKHDTQHYTINMQMNIQPHTHFTNTITIFTDSCICGIFWSSSTVWWSFEYAYENMYVFMNMCMWSKQGGCKKNDFRRDKQSLI